MPPLGTIDTVCLRSIPRRPSVWPPCGGQTVLASVGADAHIGPYGNHRGRMQKVNAHGGQRSGHPTAGSRSLRP